MLISHDFICIQMRDQDVPLQWNSSTHKRFINGIDQPLSVRNVYIHREILHTLLLLIDVDVFYFISIQLQRIIKPFTCIFCTSQFLWQFLFCISERNICICFYMLCDQRIEIKICSNIRICHNHIFFFLLFEYRKNIGERFHSSPSHTANRLLGKWRKDTKSSVLTAEIPLSATT